MHRWLRIAAPIALALTLAGNVSAASLTLRFTGLTTPVYPGQYATASVAASSGARCSIEVDYYSGPSHAAGLYTKRVPSSGRLSWTWKVGTRTYAGSWPVIVSCSKGSAYRSVTRHIRVR